MEVKASAKYIKTSPRKVGIVVDVVRGLTVEKALEQLQFINKKVTSDVAKLIKSAVANAENNFDLDVKNLFVKVISVNDGPTLHRWKPRARGRATPIRKRTSHIMLTLGELVDSGEKTGKKQKIDDPVKLGKTPKQDEGLKAKSKKDKKVEKKDKDIEEKDKEIKDPRGEGRGKNTKVEGRGSKGFGNKFFRRKSG